MNYDRFSQLWDALVTGRPKPAPAVPIPNGMSAHTAEALIEYGGGNKSRIQAIREVLGHKKVA